jgi:hypothetical protein
MTTIITASGLVGLAVLVCALRCCIKCRCGSCCAPKPVHNAKYVTSFSTPCSRAISWAVSWTSTLYHAHGPSPGSPSKLSGQGLRYPFLTTMQKHHKFRGPLPADENIWAFHRQSLTASILQEPRYQQSLE